MPARKLKSNTPSVVAGKIGSKESQDTLRDDPMKRLVFVLLAFAFGA
jgi:hypothetical protein